MGVPRCRCVRGKHRNPRTLDYLNTVPPEQVSAPSDQEPISVMKEALTALLMLLCTAGCAPRDPAPVSDNPRLNSFVQQVARNLETHAWQEILAAADRGHYQTQVTEHGMGEPQYVAELFGLHRVGNNIKRNGVVQWADLERIGSVELEKLTRSGGEHQLTGSVVLEDGTLLQLQAQIVQVQDQFVLTGGVG